MSGFQHFKWKVDTAIYWKKKKTILWEEKTYIIKNCVYFCDCRMKGGKGQLPASRQNAETSWHHLSSSNNQFYDVIYLFLISPVRTNSARTASNRECSVYTIHAFYILLMDIISLLIAPPDPSLDTKKRPPLYRAYNEQSFFCFWRKQKNEIIIIFLSLAGEYNNI